MRYHTFIQTLILIGLMLGGFTTRSTGYVGPNKTPPRIKYVDSLASWLRRVPVAPPREQGQHGRSDASARQKPAPGKTGVGDISHPEGSKRRFSPSIGQAENTALSGRQAAETTDRAGMQHTLSGVVRDALAGWPLYANIQIASDATSLPGLEAGAWTHPLTGAYSFSLPEGAPLTLTVTAWVEGYDVSRITHPPLTDDSVLNINLAPDGLGCATPGYIAPILLEEDFETMASIPGNGWAQADVNETDGNWVINAHTLYPSGYNPHSGAWLAFFNSYQAQPGAATRLYRTSGLDLSQLLGAQVSLWVFEDNEYNDAADVVQVQVSIDSGATWSDVGEPIARYNPVRGWQQHTVDLSATTGPGMTDVRIALLGVSDYGNNIHIDDVVVMGALCVPADGGLVVGNVRDANTMVALAGATVETESGSVVASQITPDPAVEDGFYSFFAPAGSSAFTAHLALYGMGASTVTVVVGETTAQDILLPAGRLVVTPTTLQADLTAGDGMTLPLTLHNAGGKPLAYELLELDASAISPWLMAYPVSGTLAPDGQQIINVIFDSGGVAQPSAYPTAMQIGTDTPYAALSVPVTMTVHAPADWGHISGVVTGLDPCDIDPTPLTNAAVTLTAKSGMSWTLAPHADGSYSRWLPAAYSPLTITVSAAGYVGTQVPGITIDGGMTATQDFELRCDAPCVAVEPERLEITLRLGDAATLPLTLSNTGAAPSGFVLAEIDGDTTPPAYAPVKAAWSPDPDYIERWHDFERTALLTPWIAWDSLSALTIHSTSLQGLIDKVPWLSGQPLIGTIGPDSVGLVEITVSALPTLPTTIAYPVFGATLVVGTDNRGDAAFIHIPITLTVFASRTLTTHIAGSGAVAVDPTKATYDYGDVVTLTAVPAPGWTFVSWVIREATATHDWTDNPLVVAITSDTVVTATFVADLYVLDIEKVGSGTVAVEPDRATFAHGETITLTAVPNFGWVFGSWSGDLGRTSNPFTFTITDHTHIVANFLLEDQSNVPVYLPLIARRK